jgi:hypothetical protein
MRLGCEDADMIGKNVAMKEDGLGRVCYEEEAGKKWVEHANSASWIPQVNRQCLGDFAGHR